MNLHNPHHWVGGYIRKEEWVLAYPLSIEALDDSIASAKSSAVEEHRCNLRLCVDVYDMWWYRVSGDYNASL